MMMNVIAMMVMFMVMVTLMAAVVVITFFQNHDGMPISAMYDYVLHFSQQHCQVCKHRLCTIHETSFQNMTRNEDGVNSLSMFQKFLHTVAFGLTAWSVYEKIQGRKPAT